MHSKASRLLPLLLCVLLLAGCACRAHMVSGELHGEQVWQGSMQVVGDVVLAEGAHLTIRPGTTVLFLPPLPGTDLHTTHPNFPGSELIIHGTLVAEGTAAAPIVFSHVDPLAPAGSWGGVNLVASPRASFRYCRFTQADSAIHSQGSEVQVEQSVFERNLVGVRFHSSAILVERNLFRQNGVAIRFHFGAPVICRNQIIDNEKGFFITSFPQDYRIEANNIVGNRDASVALGEEVPEDVEMTNNYWGTADAGAIEASFFDGRRISYIGHVLYAPFAVRPFTPAGAAWSR